MNQAFCKALHAADQWFFNILLDPQTPRLMLFEILFQIKTFYST